LLLVFVTGSLFAVGLRFTPAWMWTKCLGAGFRMSGGYDLSYLATLYAIKSVIYSVSVVFITFEMAYKIANSNAVQLAFSAILIAGVYEFHSSLLEVILVQLAILTVLAVSSAVPMLIGLRSGPDESNAIEQLEPVSLLRKVSEDEVIAEFLRSDFSNAGFRECPVAWREIIMCPDLADAKENMKRRAIHMLRHLTLWNEIPHDTEWYEVRINKSALEQVRVFPRAQWRKLARGNFAITRITEDLRARRHKLNAKFISKITAIEEQLRQGDHEFGAVILLGESKEKPVTVLDGNHRLVATMTSARELSGLRFMCGLSPQMDRCCWYKTNVATLFRYARHLLLVVLHDPRRKLLRALRKDEELNPEKGAGAKLEVGGLVVEADDART
jgi:hypothetical protein